MCLEIALWNKISKDENILMRFIVKAFLVIAPYMLINYALEKYMLSVYLSGTAFNDSNYPLIALLSNRLASGQTCFVGAGVFDIIQKIITKVTKDTPDDTIVSDTAYYMSKKEERNKLWSYLFLGFAIGGLIGLMYVLLTNTEFHINAGTVSELMSTILPVALFVGLPLATLITACCCYSKCVMNPLFSLSTDYASGICESLNSDLPTISISFDLVEMLFSIIKWMIIGSKGLLLPGLFVFMIAGYLWELFDCTFLNFAKKQ